MATDEVMKNYFARFIGHEMMFMVFSSDFHGIFTNLSFIVSRITLLIRVLSSPGVEKVKAVTKFLDCSDWSFSYRVCPYHLLYRPLVKDS